MKSLHASKSGRIPVLLAFSLFLLVSLASAGGDPWKSKPYQQWDDKDIEKIMQYSPWSRTVVIETTWDPLSASELSALNANTPGATAGTQGSGGKAGSATVMPAEHGDARTRGADASFNVYWMSSRTMRSAMVRRAVLHAGKDPAEADKFVQQQLEAYVVALKCDDMAPFMRNDEKSFTDRTSLIIKTTKQKVAPSKIEYQRDSATNKVVGVYFYFSKKGPTGEELISPQEKGVEFDCRIGNSLLKAPFEPQKMADAKGEDL